MLIRLDPVVLCGVLLDDLPALICASIIDDHKLKIHKSLCKNRIDCWSHICCGIVYWHHYRYERHTIKKLKTTAGTQSAGYSPQNEQQTDWSAETKTAGRLPGAGQSQVRYTCLAIAA